MSCLGKDVQKLGDAVDGPSPPVERPDKRGGNRARKGAQGHSRCGLHACNSSRFGCAGRRVAPTCCHAHSTPPTPSPSPTPDPRPHLGPRAVRVGVASAAPSPLPISL